MRTNMDAFVENDNGTDDLNEDEIITEEKLNEEDDKASNKMLSEKMKWEEFIEKLEEVKVQETFPETFVVLFPVQKKSQ